MGPSRDEEMGFIRASLQSINSEMERTRGTLSRLFVRMDESDRSHADAWRETDNNLAKTVRSITQGCAKHAERIQGNSARITVFLWLLGILVSLDLFLIGWVIAH